MLKNNADNFLHRLNDLVELLEKYNCSILRIYTNKNWVKVRVSNDISMKDFQSNLMGIGFHGTILNHRGDRNDIYLIKDLYEHDKELEDYYQAMQHGDSDPEGLFLDEFEGNSDALNGYNINEGDHMAEDNWQKAYFDQISKGLEQDRQERNSMRDKMDEQQKQFFQLNLDLRKEIIASNDNIRKEISASSEKTNQEIQTLRNELRNVKTEIKDYVASENEKLRKDSSSTKNWVMGIAITTIIGIAAIVVAVLVALLSKG